MACSVADSSCAAMWWNAATTRASAPSSSCASSAEEPWGGGVKSRPPPNVSGTTVLTTVLPRQPLAQLGQRVGQPVGGHGQHDDLPAAAASRFAMPEMRAPGASAASSAAFALARSASREPIDDLVPGLRPPHAQPRALPSPSLP